jgi:mitogen-activated protein kinase organizer 1
MAHPVSAVAVSDDADESTTLAAASDKTLLIYDVVTARIMRRFQGHYGRINAVEFGPGAQTYLSASYDGTVKIWDGRSRSNESIQTLKDAKDSVSDLHVLADAAVQQGVVRTASVDGVVRSYDLRKGIIQADNMGSPITGMAPTYDGLCLAVSCLDGAIRLIELESGELLNTYSGSHKSGQFGLRCCLCSDDATIVSGSEDGAAILYDLVSAQAVQRLQGHSRPVCSVATQPKISSVVITAGYDGNCIVWSHDPDYIGWQ